MKPAPLPKVHGGKRPGSGRKAKFGEPTSLMRVPESAKATVIDFLTELAEKRKTEPAWPSHLTPVRLSENPTKLKIPMFAHSVQAGFPSPADDYVADTLDLNEHLIHRREATFFVHASGESMIGAGIQDGDILVVDRSITPANGRIVIATVDGEFTVKRLERNANSVRLLPENPEFQPIEFKSEQELQIWGVVTSVIHQFKG